MNDPVVRSLSRQGVARGVGLGATVEDVIVALGEPDDRSVAAPLILKYGSCEFSFAGDRLFLIAYCLTDPTATYELSEVEAWLSEDGIDYTRDDTLTYDTRIALRVTDSAALLVFEDGILASVQAARGSN
jgi:hypothetical protein